MRADSGNADLVAILDFIENADLMAISDFIAIADLVAIAVLVRQRDMILYDRVIKCAEERLDS